MKRISIIVFILSLITHVSFAQLKKANRYYENFEYAKAIPLYKKVVKKNENPEALEKLAHSYRLTKNYSQAELYYARLMKQTSYAPINHFYYGTVLKNNNKIDEARKEFKLYASTAPDDRRAEISVKSCDEIKIWISKTQQFEVLPVQGVNTVHADFSPVSFKDQMVFVSERTKDMVNYNSYSWNKEPFLNVYSVPVKKTESGAPVVSKKAKPFSSRINTNYHDGPVAFNPEQNVMYLTRVNYVVRKDKDFVNRPGIYISTLNGRSWSKVKPFQYNNEKYSVAHPAVSPDGQWLFFSSDMAGSVGGMDIFMCKKEGDGWGQPQNLGGEVNTDGDEVFPYMRKDGTLFFASDGHIGFGGLDIFSCIKKDNKFAEVKNLGSPLNSFTDDFGITFTDDTKGFFSSDRAGSVGSDDIYAFTALNKFLTVSGKILLSKSLQDPAKNAEIMLLTEDGKVLQISTTDNTGFFKFENLDPDGKYMVKLDETDPVFNGKDKYYLADEKGKIIRVTVINDKGGKFLFTNLPFDPNAMPQQGIEDDVTIAGNILYGENPSKPLSETKVNLVNEKGEVVQTATTNAFGAFVFSNLPADQNFIVKVDESDTQLSPNTKIIITNKSGKEMQTTTAGSKGDFKFAFLSTDKNSLQLMVVEDSELRFDLKGNLVSENKSPLPNSVINIVNEKGEVLQSVKTDAKGSFQFTNLPADQNLLFSVDENDPKFKSLSKLYITDGKGNVIREFSRSNGKFTFTLLPTEQSKMGLVYVDDPWLKVLQLKNEAKKDSLTIVENIYYNYGEYKILPEAQKTLDKVINLMKNDPQLIMELFSHTDSRSSSEYNMRLSQQRVKAAVDYIATRGIGKERISGKGYGESKLINACKDGVECTEEEHAKNRRTEFKILRKQK
jgi:outer membrane protein OmpA-like peptidoglycan-associated protein